MKYYSRADRPPKVVKKNFGKSLTRQSEADACDVNLIMARYEKTGVLPSVGREAFFADVSEMGDYREALENVRRADEAFMSLPAKVRGRFGNDAAEFLDFCSDVENRAEMVEMGLIEDESGVPEVVETPETPAPEGGEAETE